MEAVCSSEDMVNLHMALQPRRRTLAPSPPGNPQILSTEGNFGFIQTVSAKLGTICNEADGSVLKYYGKQSARRK
jgi:hypothetical protein